MYAEDANLRTFRFADALAAAPFNIPAAFAFAMNSTFPSQENCSWRLYVCQGFPNSTSNSGAVRSDELRRGRGHFVVVPGIDINE